VQRLASANRTNRLGRIIIVLALSDAPGFVRRGRWYRDLERTTPATGPRQGNFEGLHSSYSVVVWMILEASRITRCDVRIELLRAWAEDQGNPTHPRGVVLLQDHSIRCNLPTPPHVAVTPDSRRAMHGGGILTS
jgi:hypothetical protein